MIEKLISALAGALLASIIIFIIAALVFIAYLITQASVILAVVFVTLLIVGGVIGYRS